ncbi:ATP-binding protein [Roseateles cellulosilyticus]|uniref:AAA family ATPase n=1 Tax=Pelomonas cellulosilytica TaxID=2906762 RepID=A0ABS8XPQ3_9BURK|nr:AAA family ATPase [Pelomonas sp. P8]MCE4553642.1 AAA family ATPase [Pelomonas sp. P8]
MLRLLTPPAWAPDGVPARPLPATVPAALLVVLTTQPAGLPRDRLAALFWPDASATDALHHLRVNLHRARALLRGWGVAEALQTDGPRVRLSLPCDLAGGAPADAPPLDPADWPPAWRLAGYDGFTQWCRDTALALHRSWLRERRQALAPGDAGAAPAPPARETEHRELRHSGAPALLLLGEPGAGKTTLLQAAFPHAPVLRGLEGLHGMPYRPLLDALRGRMPALQAALDDGDGPLRPYRLDLARLLPELAPDEPLPPLDALTAQARLVEALTRAFEALTPVLLVDDLQWCDTATVEWLLLLAHGDRLRWRAAARRHEMGAGLHQALQPLSTVGRLQTLDLAALTRADLPAVCRARWPDSEFGDAQLDRLHTLSAGNPFALGELVAAGAPAVAGSDALPERVRQMVQRRLQALPALARKVVEAAAVFVQPVPEDGLHRLLGLPDGEAGDADWAAARDQALAAGMLRVQEPGLTCSHDLIREATAADLAGPRRAALHRHAALWLAGQPWADAMAIAEHWRAAGEPQTALAWRHEGAEQLKARGRYDEACAVWREVADESLDLAQSLRARLELAACDLLEDLARGEAALAAIHAQLAGVADPEQHRLIEGRLRAALVDNRVFAGDLPAAMAHATRLRELLPELPQAERVHAYEVLIELAMREPDIPGAWALLARLREAAPRLPAVLSFEGQIHWFGGQVQAAHDALARLLERHPDYCRGLTVENDLAVMLHALGDLPAAEDMARRSLRSWAGVIHTETLSSLALGSVLTSAGRHDEADAALRQALDMARAQSSGLFEAEARVRLARLRLQCGHADEAATLLDAAAPLLRDAREPLRVSNWVLMSTLTATALGGRPAPEQLARLREASARLQHPLVQAREARVDVELALADGDGPAALAATERQAAVARGHGLQEWALEAALMALRARALMGQPDAALRPLAADTQAQAAARGYAELHWRASAWLAARAGTPADARRARAALAVLRGGARPSLFDAAAAARREPRWG